MNGNGKLKPDFIWQLGCCWASSGSLVVVGAVEGHGNFYLSHFFGVLQIFLFFIVCSWKFLETYKNRD
jgi:hypothetical protein